jgi:hypothetical protein
MQSGSSTVYHAQGSPVLNVCYLAYKVGSLDVGEVTLCVADYFYFSLVCVKKKLSLTFYVIHDLCIIQIYTIMTLTNAHVHDNQYIHH